jgi:pimeloyl-ACP methyl ester carboxylesterase
VLERRDHKPPEGANVSSLRYYVTAVGLATFAAAGAGQSAAPGRDELKFVNVTGTKLAYVEAGRGEPIVFVHGAFSDYRYWAHQLEIGAEGFHVVAYSRRDFHPNSRDSAEALQTPDRDVADLIELIETLDIGPAHLVGHSSGGHIALVAAIRRPDLVRSLVLEEGGFVDDHAESRQVITEVVGVRERYMKYRARGEHEAAVQRFIDFVSGDGYFASSSPATKQLYMDNESAFGVRPNAPLTCTETASLQRPVLVVLGERSPASVRRLMVGLLECLGDEQTVRIPEASHGIHYEQPGAFNRAVFQFIGAQ